MRTLIVVLGIFATSLAAPQYTEIELSPYPPRGSAAPSPGTPVLRRVSPLPSQGPPPQSSQQPQRIRRPPGSGQATPIGGRRIRVQRPQSEGGSLAPDLPIAVPFPGRPLSSLKAIGGTPYPLGFPQPPRGTVIQELSNGPVIPLTGPSSFSASEESDEDDFDIRQNLSDSKKTSSEEDDVTSSLSALNAAPLPGPGAFGPAQGIYKNIAKQPVQESPNLPSPTPVSIQRTPTPTAFHRGTQATVLRPASPQTPVHQQRPTRPQRPEPNLPARQQDYFDATPRPQPQPRPVQRVQQAAPQPIRQVSRPPNRPQARPVINDDDDIDDNAGRFSKAGKRNKKPVAQTLNRYRHENEDGSITWGFENDDGSFKEETIGVDCVVRGKYGYVDPEGTRREYSYSSGNPCDPDKKQQEQEESGFYDYQDNKYVLPGGRTIDLNAASKHRSRRPQRRASSTQA